MRYPKIAILLAAYNGEKWIKEQIITILNQNNVSLDIYISLDLSTDDTFGIVTELQKMHHNIILLPYGQRFGSAEANFYHLILNVPVENYDYTALSDQDDIWLENKLSRAVDVLQNEAVFGYSSNVLAFWANGKQKLIKKAYPQRRYDYLFESPGPGCTFVLKRELILRIKNYFHDKVDKLCDLKYHDWLIYAFARSYQYKWVIDDEALIEYRQHTNNQLGVNIGLRAFRFRVKKILVGVGIEQVIRTICFLNLENNEFVRQWYILDRVDYLRLAFFSKYLRRNIRDRFLLFCFCLFCYSKQIFKKEFGYQHTGYKIG